MPAPLSYHPVVGDGFSEKRGGSGGEGTPQTRSRSNPQPVPAVQPRASSGTVQSLAPAPMQKPSASTKSISEQSDPTHTEQPALFNSRKRGSWVSEQHRTWPGGREQRGTVSTHASAHGMDALQTHPVLLVHFLEIECVRATAGRPAHDGAIQQRTKPNHVRRVGNVARHVGGDACAKRDRRTEGPGLTKEYGPEGMLIPVATQRGATHAIPNAATPEAGSEAPSGQLSCPPEPHESTPGWQPRASDSWAASAMGRGDVRSV